MDLRHEWQRLNQQLGNEDWLLLSEAEGLVGIWSTMYPSLKEYERQQSLRSKRWGILGGQLICSYGPSRGSQKRQGELWS